MALLITHVFCTCHWFYTKLPKCKTALNLVYESFQYEFILTRYIWIVMRSFKNDLGKLCIMANMQMAHYRHQLQQVKILDGLMSILKLLFRVPTFCRIFNTLLNYHRCCCQIDQFQNKWQEISG